LWTFRRNEKDVIKLYDSLSDLMHVTTSGDMLNFGYWEKEKTLPLEAQKNMCEKFAIISKLSSNQNIVDVGSGLGAPALLWDSKYDPAKLYCININFKQLKTSKNNYTKNNHINSLNFLNSTATTLPFVNESVDRVLSLESAQHFKPLKNFVSESFRILKKDGILAVAMPVLSENHPYPSMKLGTLSMTWSSEHYSIDFVKSKIKEQGFENINLKKIGSNVYEPLANYYFKNRDLIKTKISNHYPPYVEKILFKSLGKMKEASKKKIIDYVIVTCQKNN
jgi:ubiquinone/menaquinone biosynthesis C-methylase UbiE